MRTSLYLALKVVIAIDEQLEPLHPVVCVSDQRGPTATGHKPGESVIPRSTMKLLKTNRSLLKSSALPARQLAMLRASLEPTRYAFSHVRSHVYADGNSASTPTLSSSLVEAVSQENSARRTVQWASSEFMSVA